jgi:hypothetical protein
MQPHTNATAVPVEFRQNFLVLAAASAKFIYISDQVSWSIP